MHRRTLLAAGAAAVSTAAGCLGTLDDGTPTCPTFPDTEDAVCRSGSDVPATLAVADRSDGETGAVLELSVTDGAVGIRPSAHGIFDRRAGEWRPQRVIEATDEDRIELTAADRYRFQVRFDGRIGTERIDPRTTRITTGVSTAGTYGFAVPLVVDGQSVSLGTTYEVPNDRE